MGVADHAEHAAGLGGAVDGEVGVEDFVAAVFAIGLGEHHQFHVGGVALQAGKGANQVIDLVVGQRQAKTHIGLQERSAAPAQHVASVQGRGLQNAKQGLGLRAVGKHALGHAVVQQSGAGLELLGREAGLGQQTAFERQAVLHHALHAFDGQTAVVRNVRGFGRPRRERAQARRHQQHQAVRSACEGLTVIQQSIQASGECRIWRTLGGHPVHKAARNAADLVVHPLQGGHKSGGAETAERVTAFEGTKVQGHGEGFGGGGEQRSILATRVGARPPTLPPSQTLG